MTYRDAHERLYSLDFAGVKLGLDNIRRMCRSLHDPQERFASIHVAGTNGKGSVCAMLDSILRAEGYRVGRFTSPHLRDVRERIHVDGRPISRRWFTDFIERHWPMIVRDGYSFFEVITAMAFDTFAKAGCDCAVVEVGLGGRLDATNILNSDLSIITGIAMDHQHILGNSYRRIAREKAGIIRTGTPVITGALVPEAARVINAVAEEKDAPLFTAHSILSDRSIVGYLPGSKECWSLSLAGTHQMANAAIAVAVSIVLNEAGITVSRNSVRRGLHSTHWPARFQLVSGRPTVIFDAGHNPDGISATAHTWHRVFGRRRAVCVFATRSDKDHARMIAALEPVTDYLIGCPLPSMPGIDRDTLESHARSIRVPFEWRRSPRAAYSRARRLAGPDGLVLISGSHFLTGALIPVEAVWPNGSRLPHSYPLTRQTLLRSSAPVSRPQ